MEDRFSDLKEFVAQFASDEFKPFAYYDKHLDCIRVYLQDCSFIEKRIGEIYTLMVPAHPERHEGEYVGFFIKGVRHLFKELGLPDHGAVKLAEILNEIVQHYPDQVATDIKEFFGPAVAEMEVEVEFEEAA